MITGVVQLFSPSVTVASDGVLVTVISCLEPWMMVAQPVIDPQMDPPITKKKQNRTKGGRSTICFCYLRVVALESCLPRAGFQWLCLVVLDLEEIAPRGTDRGVTRLSSLAALQHLHEPFLRADPRVCFLLLFLAPVSLAAAECQLLTMVPMTS